MNPAIRALTATAFVLLVKSFAPSCGRAAEAGEPPPSASPPTIAGSPAPPPRWDSALPFLGDKARARGYHVPLPLGISANIFYCERDIEVKSVDVSLNNGPPHPVDQFLDFGVRTHITSVLARADAWIFPFLNVYALGGGVGNRSAVKINLINPFPGIPSVLIDQTSEFSGSIYGGGATLAGGYKRLFFAFDGNFSVIDLGFAEQVHAAIYTARIGWNGKARQMPLRAWVGVSYWDSERNIKGSLPVEGGTLNYDVLQKPLHPWNAELGASLEVKPSWSLTLILGANFDDMFSAALNVAYRF